MTQGERQNFNWRPNDFSSQTRLRYSMEADHWIESIKSATTKTTTSLGETLGFLGLLLGFTINLLMVIVLTLTHIFQWLNRRFNDRTPNQVIDVDEEVIHRRYTDEEVEEISRTGEHVDIYDL